MAHYEIEIASGPPIRLSAYAFRKTANEFLTCYRLYEKESKSFSIVPFFLCCRAIELGLKSWHLESATQPEVKKQYSHNILKTYQELPVDKKVLSSQELCLLSQVNEIYSDKRFEYFPISDAMTAFKKFPDLQSVARLAEKIVASV